MIKKQKSILCVCVGGGGGGRWLGGWVDRCVRERVKFTGDVSKMCRTSAGLLHVNKTPSSVSRFKLDECYL